MSNYPNPCDSCPKCVATNGCEAWRIRYLYRQKQINIYAGNLYRKKPPVQVTFQYEHPDIVRRYIAEGPCRGCTAENKCDTPCPAYLRWWNARMEIARKKTNYDTD